LLSAARGSGALRDPAVARRLGWVALSPILAAVYVPLLAVVVAAVALSVVGIGLLLLAPLLRVAGFLADLERHQAEDLLGARVAGTPEASDRSWREVVEDPMSWRAVGWLAVRSLIGLALAGVFAVAGLTAVALSVIPFDPGYLRWEDWSSPGGPAYAWTLLLLVPLTAATVLLCAAIGAIAARLVPLALGTPADPRDYELLRRRTQTLDARSRLAQELHDAIGHSLTVTVLQAEAAQALLTEQPAAARSALEVIERSTRQALEELDRVLGMLRRTERQTGPPPDLDDLDGLIDAVVAAGLPVEVQSLDLSGVTATSGRAAYRIVQEALTNVLRHAGTVPTTVRLELTDGGLVVEVHNEPGSESRTRRGPGGGEGISGLTERVRLLGGTFESGRTPDRGFRLRAELPR